MNILSLFVLIPLLMLGALWAARSLNQVRGVMVVGSTLLLALAVFPAEELSKFTDLNLQVKPPLLCTLLQKHKRRAVLPLSLTRNTH